MDNHTIACTWGERIRQARVAEGWSVAEFAELVGVTRASVYKWEGGDAIPTPEMQLRISKKLKRPHLSLFRIDAA